MANKVSSATEIVDKMMEKHLVCHVDMETKPPTFSLILRAFVPDPKEKKMRETGMCIFSTQMKEEFPEYERAIKIVLQQMFLETIQATLTGVSAGILNQQQKRLLQAVLEKRKNILLPDGSKAPVCITCGKMRPCQCDLAG